MVAKKEGHGFRGFDNQVSLFTRMPAFSETYIGGKKTTAQATQ